MAEKNQLPQGWGKANALPEDWGKASTNQLNSNSEDSHSQNNEVVHEKKETPEAPIKAVETNKTRPTEEVSEHTSISTSSPEMDTELPQPRTKKKKKVLPILLAVMVIIVVAAVGLLAVFLLPKLKGDQPLDPISTTQTTGTKEMPVISDTESTTTVVTTAPQITSTAKHTTSTTHSATTTIQTTSNIITTPPVTTTEPITGPDIPLFDVSWFVDVYFWDENLDIHIEKIENNIVIFDLSYYSHITHDYEQHNTIIAILNGNVAEFSYSGYADATVAGTLTFEDDSITIAIIKTDSSIVIGTYYLITYSFDDPELDTTEPNVWCPNCGYGFYTSGVGISGFTCPECNYKFNDPVDSHSQEFFEIAGYYEEYDYILDGERVITYYDACIYLYSNGIIQICTSSTDLFYNWDVGVIWDETNPSDQILFDVDNGYLTLYLNVPGHNAEWVFKKIY